MSADAFTLSRLLHTKEDDADRPLFVYVRRANMVLKVENVMDASQLDLSTKAKKIIEVMRGRDWLTRKEIAHLMGKNNTSGRYEIQQLLRLRKAGLIDERRDASRPGQARYLYRVLTPSLLSENKA
jgi:hypothetical protein